MKVGDLVTWASRASHLPVTVGTVAGIVLYTFPSRGNVEILDPAGLRVEIQCHFLETTNASL